MTHTFYDDGILDMVEADYFREPDEADEFRETHRGGVLQKINFAPPMRGVVELTPPNLVLRAVRVDGICSACNRESDTLVPSQISLRAQHYCPECKQCELEIMKERR